MSDLPEGFTQAEPAPVDTPGLIVGPGQELAIDYSMYAGQLTCSAHGSPPPCRVDQYCTYTA